MSDDRSWYVAGELVYYAARLSSTLKEAQLIPISDVHFGSPFFSFKHFKRTLDWLGGADNRFAVLNGDLCDTVIRDSKGDLYRQIKTPQDQRDWVIEQLKPYRTKLLGMTTGNHEARIADKVGVDISRDIAEALHIPYRPEGLLLKIMFGDDNNRTVGKPWVYWCYFTHGYGGARTKGAKAVKVERTATYVHADVYIMSHDHDVNVAPAIYFLPDNRTRIDPESGFEIGRVVAHRKVLIKSNAYIKWGGYGEMGGFAPVALEAPVITMSGQGHKWVKVEV